MIKEVESSGPSAPAGGSASPPRPGRASHSARPVPAAARSRAALMSSLQALILADRDAAISMGAVAAGAGMAVGTIYNYFESKEDLMLALLELRGEDFLAAIDAAGDGQPTFSRTLVAMLSATFGNDPRVATYFEVADPIFRQVGFKAYREAEETLCAGLRPLFARGVREGSLREWPPTLHTAFFVKNLFVALEEVRRARLARHEALDVVLSVTLRGLAAPSASAPGTNELG